jgi:uncharacterized membrane protein
MKVVRKIGEFLTRHWLMTAIMLALTALIIVLAIGANQAVWFDEAYSIRVAKENWGELWHFSAVDAHPPLYYALLKIWGLMFGYGDLALRLLSTLCLAGVVLLTIGLIKKSFNRQIALLAAPFVAFAPFLLRYGFEIRMYSLAALIAVGSTLVLMKLVEKPKRRWWIGYGILVALGMWTLNFMVLVFIAHLVWLLLRYYRSRPRPKFWRQPWIKSYLLAVLLYLPWLFNAISQYQHNVASGVETALGPIQALRAVSFAFLYQPEFSLDKFQGALLILAVSLAVFTGVKTWRLADKHERATLQLLLAIFLVPFIVLILLGLVMSRGMFVERYMAHFVFAGYALIGIFAAVCLVKYRPKWPAVISYIILLTMLVIGIGNLATAGNFNWQRMDKTESAEIAREFNCPHDTALVVDDVYYYIEIAEKLPDCASLYFWTNPSANYERGGYAPVNDIEARLLDNQITESKVVVFRASTESQNYEMPQHFVVPADYQLIRVEKFNKIAAEIYHKN